MKYVRVGWKHQHPAEPVALYSELDDNRFEVRKIEVFRNGRFRVCERRVGKRRYEARHHRHSRVERDRKGSTVRARRDHSVGVRGGVGSARGVTTCVLILDLLFVVADSFAVCCFLGTILRAQAPTKIG
jgi:uncharacterized protein DUF6881